MPPGDYVGLWKEINRLRDRMHQITSDIAAANIGVEELKRVRATLDVLSNRITRIETQMDNVINNVKERRKAVMWLIGIIVAVTNIISGIFVYTINGLIG